MGVESGDLTDSRFISSSNFHNDTSAYSARLNNQPDASLPESQGAWVSEYDNPNQWIQANLLRKLTVTGVIIQGNPSADKWVTKFKVMYSLNNLEGPTHWDTVVDGDQNELVSNMLLQQKTKTNKNKKR